MLRVHTWIGLNFLILTSLLFSGCALAPKLPDLPRDANLIRGQLQIHSDFELPQRHRLLDELTAQRSDSTFPFPTNRSTSICSRTLKRTTSI
jgi:hypothetical protein